MTTRKKNHQEISAIRVMFNAQCAMRVGFGAAGGLMRNRACKANQCIKHAWVWSYLGRRECRGKAARIRLKSHICTKDVELAESARF